MGSIDYIFTRGSQLNLRLPPLLLRGRVNPTYPIKDPDLPCQSAGLLQPPRMQCLWQQFAEFPFAHLMAILHPVHT